jgi:hypothetical protein
VCIALSLASIFIVAAPGKTEAPDKVAIKSDRNNPVEAPKKTTTSPDSQPKKSGKKSGSQTTLAPLSNCVFEDILVLDTIRIVFVQLFNFPPNSAIPVTITQTNAGVVGYALTPAGSFAPTLNTVVNTDSNGYGESVDVYTQGQVIGQTTTYGDTPYGPTDSINFNVLPQCNCPAIPVIP